MKLSNGYTAKLKRPGKNPYFVGNIYDSNGSKRGIVTIATHRNNSIDMCCKPIGGFSSTEELDKHINDLQAIKECCSIMMYNVLKLDELGESEQLTQTKK